MPSRDTGRCERSGSSRDHHPRRRRLGAAVRHLQSRRPRRRRSGGRRGQPRRGSPRRSGWAATRVVWMNQVHGDHVVRRRRPGGPTRVDETDALVTTTPRLALAVVTADCVPVLMADARAGVVAAVHAGRVGAQKGVVRAGRRGDAAPRARTSRTSRCCSAPRSAAATTRCPRRWPPRSRPRCPAVAPRPSRGTPGLDLRAGIARQLTDFGCHRHRRRPALHGRRPQPVQPSARRPDRTAGVPGVDGMTAVASARERRTGRRSDRGAGSTGRAPRQAAGRDVDDIELLPITKFFPASRCALFCRRLGCRAFGESREQEAAAKVAEVRFR